VDYKKFRNILIENKAVDSYVSQKIVDFSNNSNYSSSDNVFKLMRYFGEKLNTYVFQVPIKKLEIGATYFEDSAVKVLILNSNLPKNMMHFTFGHEIYHMLDGAGNRFDDRNGEVILTNSYYEDEIERKASLFASKLLMPEIEFKKIFNLYNNKCEKMVEVAIELMYYFEVTYVSVLLRMYELDLLKDPEISKKLLEKDEGDIESYFDALALDKEILAPSKIDESHLILRKIQEKGFDLVDEELLSRENLEIKIKNSEERFLNFVGDADAE